MCRPSELLSTRRAPHGPALSVVHNVRDMPEIDFEVPLDDTYLEWMRVRFSTLRGKVTTFMVQYETTFAGRRVPVVRYDNAHGFVHRDLLNRRGQLIAKTRLENDPDSSVALNIGEPDILDNWPHYLEQFIVGE